jgi:hypothetical protein
MKGWKFHLEEEKHKSKFQHQQCKKKERSETKVFEVSFHKWATVVKKTENCNLS